MSKYREPPTPEAIRAAVAEAAHFVVAWRAAPSSRCRCRTPTPSSLRASSRLKVLPTMPDPFPSSDPDIGPDDIAHRPGAPGLVRAVLTAIEREEAQSRDEEAEAEEQAQAARAAEPAEELVISDEVMFGEAPDVVEADTEGLPPMRARLVRFFAWLDVLRAARDEKEAARHAFLRSMNAPVVTEAEITELVASDKMSWVRHILSLSSQPTAAPPPTRGYEREQLLARLQGEQHDREVALAGYDEVVRQIEHCDAEISMLQTRLPDFVRDAVEERGDQELAGRYVAAIAELEAVTRQAAGLGVALGARCLFRNQFDADDIRMSLTNFHFRSAPWYRGGEMVRLDAPLRPEIKVDRAEAIAASAPYVELTKLWSRDPRAETKDTA